MTNSRAEEGCLYYSCNEDVMAPNEFLFVEHWKDPEAVKIHFGMEYCAVAQTAAGHSILSQAVPAELRCDAGFGTGQQHVAAKPRLRYLHPAE